jgi:3-oxoadipate enol-lactonase
VPVVLLHGLGATAAVNWFACFESLGRDRRVVALDQRGHGRGIRPGLRGFRLEDCADDVVATADALGIPRVIPVGYSMGGPVAQLVWHRHPDRVAGLVLCATARNFRGTRRPDVTDIALASGLTAAATALRFVPPTVRRQMVRAGVARRAADRGVPEWVVAELGGHDPASIVEAARALGQFSSTGWIGGVDVPSAVVVTARDGLVAPGRQHKLAASIPGAEVFPVDGDHSVCVTDPPAFTPVLVRACASVAARSVTGA